MPHDTTITPRFHENYARRQIEDHHVMWRHLTQASVPSYVHVVRFYIVHCFSVFLTRIRFIVLQGVRCHYNVISEILLSLSFCPCFLYYKLLGSESCGSR
jgi:hypothetical protein